MNRLPSFVAVDSALSASTMDSDNVMCRSPSFATVNSITSRTSPDLIVDFPPVRRVAPHKTPRVSFANEIRIEFVERLSTDLWYSRQDIQAFKFQTALILKMAKANNMNIAQLAEMNVQDTSVFLGLEKLFSDTTYREIEHQKYMHRRAILSEQLRQLRHGVYNADALARESEATSDWCRRRARIIGLLHADKV